MNESIHCIAFFLSLHLYLYYLHDFLHNYKIISSFNHGIPFCIHAGEHFPDLAWFWFTVGILPDLVRINFGNSSPGSLFLFFSQIHHIKSNQCHVNIFLENNKFSMSHYGTLSYPISITYITIFVTYVTHLNNLFPTIWNSRAKIMSYLIHSGFPYCLLISKIT